MSDGKEVITNDDLDAGLCTIDGTEHPCIEPYHHDLGHRTKAGVTWPKGSDRPEEPA
jgi:hypothetical protein